MNHPSVSKSCYSKLILIRFLCDFWEAEKQFNQDTSSREHSEITNLLSLLLLYHPEPRFIFSLLPAFWHKQPHFRHRIFA